MSSICNTSALERYEIATGTTIPHYGLVALDGDGKAVPASDTVSCSVIGVAEKEVDGKIEVVSGIFAFANDTDDPLTRADRGKAAFVKDALTVDAAGSANKVVAGIVVDVVDGDVYLDTTPAALAAANALPK